MVQGHGRCPDDIAYSFYHASGIKRKIPEDWGRSPQRLEEKVSNRMARNDCHHQCCTSHVNAPNFLREQAEPSKTELENRFTIRRGQVLFDGRDLRIGTGAALEITEALVRNFSHVVPFQTLGENSEQREASEKIRTAIARIKRILKAAKIPVIVENRKAEGYVMLPAVK